MDLQTVKFSQSVPKYEAAHRIRSRTRCVHALRISLCSLILLLTLLLFIFLLSHLLARSRFASPLTLAVQSILLWPQFPRRTPLSLCVSVLAQGFGAVTPVQPGTIALLPRSGVSERLWRRLSQVRRSHRTLTGCRSASSEANTHAAWVRRRGALALLHVV